MNVFAVISTNETTLPAIESAVTATFAENYIQAGKTAWLVADWGTTLAVSKKLGITDRSDMGGVLVINFTSYYGRASANIWEWIKTKLEASPAPAPAPTSVPDQK